MNKYVRWFFLPIMIIAGIFTGFMCALIVAPIALLHRIREMGYESDDLQKSRQIREQRLKEIFGEKA